MSLNCNRAVSIFFCIFLTKTIDMLCQEVHIERIDPKLNKYGVVSKSQFFFVFVSQCFLVLSYKIQ